MHIRAIIQELRLLIYDLLLTSYTTRKSKSKKDALGGVEIGALLMT